MVERMLGAVPGEGETGLSKLLTRRQSLHADADVRDQRERLAPMRRGTSASDLSCPLSCVFVRCPQPGHARAGGDL